MLLLQVAAKGDAILGKEQHLLEFRKTLCSGRKLCLQLQTVQKHLRYVSTSDET